MKLFRPGAIELLETRIAPATIVIQAGSLNPPGGQVGEIDYTDPDSPAEDAIFINTEDDPSDPISAVVGAGVVGVADTFYARLAPTTILKVFGGTGFQPLISGNVSGTSGTVGTIIAFFVDKNLDNDLQPNELTGLALGKNVKAIVSGNVDGDVITNFNNSLGKLGGSSEAGGVATDLLKNSIADVSISGDVTGSVVSGGQINNLQVGGRVANVLAGTAADGYSYDFNTAGIVDGGDVIAVGAPGSGKVGISIVKAAVGAVGIMRAGDGGAGAAGGNLSTITILADTDGFTLRAGDGGDGISGKAVGGAGGTIKTVVANGLDAGLADPTDNDQITIRGGDGGDALATGKRGGVGGAVQNIFVGYEKIPGESDPVRSVTAVEDAVRVESGRGGNGQTAGAGGALKSISLFAAPTGAGNDLEIIGGNGGDTNFATGAKAGAGAAISTIFALNPANPNPNGTDPAHDSKITLEAGDGGVAAAGGSGANGGAITKARLTGFSLDLRGGDGSAGTVGGKGGNVSSILIPEGSEGVRAENILIDAGTAGVGTNGRGGNGGNVSDLNLRNTDLMLLAINATAGAGDGGDSKKGAGGLGGSVSAVSITEFDTGVAGTATIRAGNGGAGGDGSSAGGAGGAGGTVRGVSAQNMVQFDATISGGDGGSATLKGAGGAGGKVSRVAFFSAKQSGGEEVTFNLNGGDAGDGAAGGVGGVGGNVISASVGLGQAIRDITSGIETTTVDGGQVTVSGGDGGDGGSSGAAGRGGSVLDSSFLTFAGGVSVTAADAGNGLKPGAGGRIENVAVDVGTTVTLQAGDGSAGGAGGAITRVGYSRAVEDTRLVREVVVDGELELEALADIGSAPLGAISVRAGDGSGAGQAAGSGGSITDLSGFVGLTGATTFRAGDAGSVAAKSGKGGSIQDLSLFGGGGVGVEVRIQAGDAADAANAKTGGVGGDIRRVGIGVNSFDTVNPLNPNNSFAIDPATIVRHVAAGNGGDTSRSNGTGGRGGKVEFLDSQHDIGVRSGEGFGFETMGGIFVGMGGINTTTPGTATALGARSGAAGSVASVTADAIATIVAGRPAVDGVIGIQNLAKKVDKVILNGLENPTVVDENGAFMNFGTANLIGGIVDPLAPGVDYDADNDPTTGQPVLHPHANTFDLELAEFVDNDGNGEFSLGDTITANTDGMIAAISFINNLANARPEALLTVRGGTPTFIDLNNTNGQSEES